MTEQLLDTLANLSGSARTACADAFARIANDPTTGAADAETAELLAALSDPVRSLVLAVERVLVECHTGPATRAALLDAVTAVNADRGAED